MWPKSCQKYQELPNHSKNDQLWFKLAKTGDTRNAILTKHDLKRPKSHQKWLNDQIWQSMTIITKNQQNEENNLHDINHDQKEYKQLNSNQSEKGLKMGPKLFDSCSQYLTYRFLKSLNLFLVSISQGTGLNSLFEIFRDNSKFIDFQGFWIYFRVNFNFQVNLMWLILGSIFVLLSPNKKSNVIFEIIPQRKKSHFDALLMFSNRKTFPSIQGTISNFMP